MSEIDVRDFFEFRSKLVRSYIMVCPVELYRDENDVSGHLKLIKGDLQGMSFPLIFKQESGKKINDILDTGFCNLYLISERMKAILEENELTGWKSYPIKIYDKKNEEIHGYHGFSVIGQSGPTIYSNCEIVERRYVPNGPICQFYKGVSIDGWDGSDFFTPKGTYEIFITRKAADVLQKNKITNMQLKNLAENETSVSNVLKDFES